MVLLCVKRIQLPQIKRIIKYIQAKTPGDFTPPYAAMP